MTNTTSRTPIPRVTIQDYQLVYGHPISGHHPPYMIPCPFHDDHEPSLSIYEGQKDGNFIWHCFGCGRSGTIYDFARELGRDVPPHLIVPLERQPLLSPDDDPERFVVESMGRLAGNERSREKLRNERGITDNIQLALRFGLDTYGNYVIPAYDLNGQVTHVKHWNPAGIRGGGKWLSSFGGVSLFGVDALAQDEILLLEGELDCACARSHGFVNALTHTGGAGTWNPEWSGLFYGKAVVIAYDNDNAGWQGSGKVATALHGIARSVRIICWPSDRPQGADVSDELRYHGGRASLLRLIKRAPAYQRREFAGEPVDWSTPHGRIPEGLMCDPGIEFSHKLVYAGIQRFTDYRTGQAYIANPTLAEYLGTSIRTVQRAVKALETAGYLEVLRHGTQENHMANVYRLRHPDYRNRAA